jgi:hypothetical protein
MPAEKFDVQPEKAGTSRNQGGRVSPTAAHAAGKTVSAVTQKKLMTARLMKSKSPVRKEFHKTDKNIELKTSIFKGPVNK